MCTCITFCWIRHLFSTTLIGTVTFGKRELCLLVLHSAGQDSCLALLCWPLGIWWSRVMCACITFCWIRQLWNTTLTGPVAFFWSRIMCKCITFCWFKQLFNTTLIGPMTFRGRELCVLVLHSAGTNSYLTLLWLVSWYLEDERYVCLYYILLHQTVI
jgi:hypothetical protein